MNITKGKQSRPQRVVIYGPEGVGKSTLAAVNAPRPIFLDTEDGTSHLDVDRVAIHDLEDLSAVMKELLVQRKDGACPYASVVLDTADRLWQMSADAVCAENQWTKGIETPGYGRGYAMAAERFRRVLKGFDSLMRAGMHVIIVCHAKVDRITPPDNPEYSKYMIKVSAPTKQAESSREYIKEWCDALLFCRFDVSVNAEERRALGRDARRVISTVPSPAWEAKNRLGLPDELPMEAGVLSCIFESEEEPVEVISASKRLPKIVQDSALNADSNAVADDKNVPQSDGGEELQPGGEWRLAGKYVSLTDAETELLMAYFRAVGKLEAGQTLIDLPMNVQAAVASRTEAALAAARKWADAQKGGEA